MRIPPKFILLSFLLFFTFQGCEDYNYASTPSDLKVNDFVWKGLNLYYLWQADVPNLADTQFRNQQDLNGFLYAHPIPEDLFQDLLNKPKSKFPVGEAIDRFSVLFSDYTQLEGILSGTTKNDGLESGFYYKDASATSIFGVVRYVIPNSDASKKDIHRGDIFYAVNGEPLNKSNINTLLGNEAYTLNLADYDNGNITPNSRSVNLTKTVLSENPVLINKVIENGTHKIGYLMYNGFYPNYENQLNNAFGQLKSQGITDFVLDLRYNSGGSVATATRLASMITGQFTGQVFAKQQWNAKAEAYFSSKNTGGLSNLFTNRINTNAALNSLNLSKIYILTSKSTASASELVINGLKPYINVVQIGDVTTGKNVGSITLYDSPTFTKKDINPSHHYAMQPLVLKIVNKVGFGDYITGLQPDSLLKEDVSNMGILGDGNEPLLNTAIVKISGGGRRIPKNPAKVFENVIGNQPEKRLKSEMYVDSALEGFLK
ncbi:S41 family peptidase [Flavobacterium psychrotolerans]|uniref:Peptidase S41 n=1 Tax=Flavobacterium psychrotolerans TaxID=2169410 RepID=A0A2U1JJN7_9FLAO|nr:S41 family peptidase [Flavobacterium psychrotolerans]PWA05357.1 peptidase S41 [Flavobacterium psychrotolerans]